MFRCLRLPCALLAGGLVLAACGGAAEAPAARSGTDEAGLSVVAAFYPLQYAAERVAGDLATVTNLTPAGAEPHDLELSPRDVAALTEADLVVHLRGFQPALDDALASAGITSGYDVAPAAHLDLAAAEAGAGEDGAGHGTDGAGHAEDGAGHGEQDETASAGGADPHFWLDPLRLADVGDGLSRRLAEVDPDHATAYAQGAAALRADLEALDGEFRAGLASCASRSLVTSHEAFGYLAERYGLEQVGISGLSPDSEPTSARLAQVTDFMRAHQVTTIYFETLASPDVATTLATETGARTAVLDPLEGLAEDAAGEDYLQVMRTDLQTLRAGQGCA